MNRELQRAVRRKLREVLLEELPVEELAYLVNRKGFVMADGSYFGGFSTTPEEWDEIDELICAYYDRAFRGGP